MTPENDFDRESYLAVNRACQDVFDQVLRERHGRAVDVGCGIGYYSNYLAQLGFEVTGLDARAENIAVARARYPKATFVVADIEADALNNSALARPFDLVLCAGLLYHLENPFRAIRNLRALCSTGGICVIESRVHWSDLPSALLLRDREGPSQALQHYAWLLSRRSLVEMLYAAGFDCVYAVPFSSPHPELKGRVFFVAGVGVTGLDGPWFIQPSHNLSSASYHYQRNPSALWQALRESFRWLGTTKSTTVP